MKFSKIMPSVSAMALATAYATTAYAQVEEAEPVADEGGLQEIVVTAQKRSETLSRTAAAVSVVGQTALDSIGARSFEDAVTTIPNVSANGLGGTLAVRGLGTNSLGQGNSTVASHVDGIFYSKLERGPATMYDIARIEVLRGPQGTLYGRNATAGVVNIITNNANTDKLEAFGDVSYGNWNLFRVRGVVNVPLSDSFAIRLTGGYESGGNWQHLPNGDRAHGADIYNLRLAWRAKVTDRITWDGRVAYTHSNSSDAFGVPTYKYNPGTGQFIRSSNPIDQGWRSVAQGFDTDGLGGGSSLYKGVSYEELFKQPSRYFSFRSNLNFELSDAFSLTYLLGYTRMKDLPGIRGGLVGYHPHYQFDSIESAWSHEVNLNYQSDRLKAILGMYSYQSRDYQGDQLVYVFQSTIDNNNFITYAPTSVDVPISIEAASGPSLSKGVSRAIFTQATFDVTDQFRITGGARYNWDRMDSNPSEDSRCPFGSALNGREPDAAPSPIDGVGLCTFGINVINPIAGSEVYYLRRASPPVFASSTKFTWKVGVEYDLAPDTMFYATVATGYKAGAAGSGSANNTAIIRPETNINYEAGIRSRLFNNTLSLNLTAFWTDYKDQQITTTDPNCATCLILVNAGKTRTRGIEFEYAWAPTPADRINGYINYLDAKFIDFRVQDDLIGYSQPSGTTTQFAGNRLAGAPEFSGRISYSHIFDLGSAGTITPTAALYWQSKAFVSYTNSLPTEIPAYTRTDIIVRYETENKRFSLEGYVNNLENKILLGQVFPLQGVSNSLFTPPRSYGIRLGVRY